MTKTLPASVWPSKALPAPPTEYALSQISDFLQKLGYTKSVKALIKEAESNNIPLDANSGPKAQTGPLRLSLGDLYVDAYLQEDDDSSDDESSDDSSTDDEQEDDEGSVSSSSSDESEVEDILPAVSTASGSTSNTSSEDESSEEEKNSVQRIVKRKREEDSDDSSDSDSESESSEDEEPASKKIKVTPPASEDSEDSSDSDDSDSDSDSDSSSADETEQPSTTIASKTQDSASDSSETLAADENAGMHPSRAERMPSTQTQGVNQTASGKKQNIPFSRIPKDTKVDPRFSSNEYVSYDYADRAYQDLVVTKGKGFTKEKNKKKRGSYRGGFIDTAPKGIQFED